LGQSIESGPLLNNTPKNSKADSGDLFFSRFRLDTRDNVKTNINGYKMVPGNGSAKPKLLVTCEIKLLG
jgi:hypothetical protein